jgi:hypothetical protein
MTMREVWTVMVLGGARVHPTVVAMKVWPTCRAKPDHVPGEGGHPAGVLKAAARSPDGGIVLSAAGVGIAGNPPMGGGSGVDGAAIR